MLKHQDLTRPVVVRKPTEVPGERQPAGALRTRDKLVAVRQRNGSCGLAHAEDKQCGPSTLGEISLRRGGKNLTTDTRQNESGPPTGVDGSTPELKMKTVVMHQVNCLVDNHVMLMLDRCKELLSGKHPCGIDYNTLMLELAQTWLEKHDPMKRAERRKKQNKKSTHKTQDSGETSRHISPATRDAVFNRDGGRCTYVGSNGKRCESTWDLEIHHDETPFSMGGNHNFNNLRLLCVPHNQLEAEHLQYYNERGAAKRPERVYGQSHMEKYFKQRE